MPLIIPGEGWHLERDRADGSVDILRLTGNWGLESVEGADFPNLDHQTRDTSSGDGQRLLDSRVSDRQIIFSVIKTGQLSAQDLSYDIDLLIDMVRPNQHAPVRIVRTRTDGTQVYLEVAIESAEAEEEDQPTLNLLETLSFVGFNPYWRSVQQFHFEAPFEDTASAPSATFTSSKSGFVVTLAGSVSGTDVSVLWNFGDGEFSREDDPSHVYDEAGTYTIRLTAYSEHGASTASADVSVS